MREPYLAFFIINLLRGKRASEAMNFGPPGVALGIEQIECTATRSNKQIKQR